ALVPLLRRRPGPLGELDADLAAVVDLVHLGATRTDLEDRFRTPEARRYIRALRAHRYAGGRGPDAAGRSAVRRELARRGGFVTRLRVLAAVPPAPRGRH
ncbi:MAG: hypothetical protein ACR2NA_03735, partial [Solirubrobacterales bacterium]